MSSSHFVDLPQSSELGLSTAQNPHARVRRKPLRRPGRVPQPDTHAGLAQAREASVRFGCKPLLVPTALWVLCMVPAYS